MEENLKRRLVDIIRDCQELVFSQYGGSRRLSGKAHGNFPTPPPPERGPEESTIVTDPDLSQHGEVSNLVSSIYQPPPSRSDMENPSLADLSNSAARIERPNAPLNSDSGYETNFTTQSDLSPGECTTSFPPCPQSQEPTDDNHQHMDGFQFTMGKADGCAGSHGEPVGDVPLDLWDELFNDLDEPLHDGTFVNDKGQVEPNGFGESTNDL
jgi:hypothetical protein